MESVRDYKCLLFLDKCGYNMAKVQATVRKHSSPKVSVRLMMKPYRKLIENYNGESKDIRAILNQLLSS